MGEKHPGVDAYIAKARDFARPILKKIRVAMHRSCPGLSEELKWNAPFFMYKGILGMMAAFKQHVTFGFWKHRLLAARVKGLPAKGAEAMGQFGRLTSAADLPDNKTFLRLVKEAALLNELGLKPRKVVAAKKDRALTIPPYFLKAVRSNPKAKGVFDAATYSFRKEYVVWVSGARTDETREKRLRTAVEWISRGKRRNWKYEK